MLRLWGACKKYIESGQCLGCNKLEDEHFSGQARCALVEEKNIKGNAINGQERIKLGGTEC